MRLLLAFLAGYGLAAYAANHRRLPTMSDAEVARRTEPYNGENVVALDDLAVSRLREFVWSNNATAPEIRDLN